MDAGYFHLAILHFFFFLLLICSVWSDAGISPSNKDEEMAETDGGSWQGISKATAEKLHILYGGIGRNNDKIG